MPDWRIPLFKVNVPPWEALEPALKWVLYSGYWAEGEEVAAFERELGEFFGSPHVFATASCTSALAIALRMAGVGHGTNVILPAMTCVATAAPVVAAGAKVIWADVEPDTGLLDWKSVARRINAATRAVIAVHWGGDVPNLARLREVCHGQRVPVPLIADMAQGFGADGRGADMACYSFQAIKHLTTADGGCMVCETESQKELGKSLSWFGIDRSNFRLPNGEINWDSDISRVGFKANMNNLTAAIGRVQLARIGPVLAAHRRNGALYEKLLADVPGVGIPIRHGQSAHWVFTITCHERDGLIARAHLQTNGIQASRMHTRLDRYSGIPATDRRPLPGTDKFSSRHLCLPCGWWVTEGEVAEICDLIREFYGGGSRGDDQSACAHAGHGVVS